MYLLMCAVLSGYRKKYSMDMEYAGKLINFIPAALLAVSCIILYDSSLSRSAVYVFSYMIGSFGFVSFVSLHGMYQVYTAMYWDPYVVLNWGLISSDIWIFSQIWAGRLRQAVQEVPDRQAGLFWRVIFSFFCAATVISAGIALW